MANVDEQDKNFKKVRFYQDKILLETELNELQDVQNRRFEDFVYDSIGNCVIYGLDVAADTGWDVTVNTGRSYTNGKIVTSKGGDDTLTIVDPTTYSGDLTLYIIARPVEPVYLPQGEGDKGWEYGVGEPTTYRTEESYEIVVAQEGAAITVGGTIYAVELPTNPELYVELARVLRPDTATDINDCTIRDTRPHLLMRLAEIVNKRVYEKAEQQYDAPGNMASASTLLITPGTNTADERDRIGADLNVTPSELTNADGTKIWDTNGDLISVVSIVTKDIDGETLPEATVTLSGDVAENVYVPIVGGSSLLLSENFDFENGTTDPTDWDKVGSPLYSTDGSESYTGNKCVKVSDGNSYANANFVPVSVGVSYRLGAYVRADSPSALTFQFKANWYNSGFSFVSSSTVDVTVTNDNYAKYTAIVTAPAGGVYLKLELDGDGTNGSNYFWVDHVDMLQVTEQSQFPLVIHYGYEYTLANLPANFAMADISSGVSIDMAIQEILGNRYFDGSLPIAPDGTNSVDKRLVQQYDELHTHRHKGIISPRLEGRDVDILNPPGTTSQLTTEDHITTVGTGAADDNNAHALSSKNIDVNADESPYTILPKTGTHGETDVSIADHILEVGTGIPDADNPHGLDSSDIEHNAETFPDSSFKTIEDALFDRVKDLSGDGIVRGFHLMAEDSNYIKVTDGYGYVNGKRVRVGDSIIMMSVTSESTTDKTFRISGALVSDDIYIVYFGANTYYRWVATAFADSGILKVTINDAALVYNYDGAGIVNYENLQWDNNEKFEAQLSATYTQISIDDLVTTNDRIDIVVLGDNGVVSVVKGVEDGSRLKPLVPNNSTKIGEVYVNYATGTDVIGYDDIGDYRFRIDWKHSGSGSGGSPTGGNPSESEYSAWQQLQVLETTVEYYRQLFVSSADLGLSLSQMAVESFIDYAYMDDANSSNVQLDNRDVYLGANEVPTQATDLVADWRNFSPIGGTGTWVSKSFVDQHAIGVVNKIGSENPTFESGVLDPDNWTKTGSPVFSTDGTKSYAGDNAVKVSFGNGYTMTNFVSAEVGKSYNISAFIKAESTSVAYQLKVLWFTIADVPIGSSVVNIDTSNSRYAEYTGVVVAPSGTAKMKMQLDGDGASGSNEFWIDNVGIVELSNIESVLFFVRDEMNGGGNEVKYYLSNDGSVPVTQVTPNSLHTFDSPLTIGSQLRVKIEVIPDNNSGDSQPRVNSFSLVWGIGDGHNHNGENSSNTLGDDPAVDDLGVIGNLHLTDNEFEIPDVAALLSYLTPPAPPVLGGEDTGNGAHPVDNGPNDMRQDWANLGFLSSNAYIPADAVLLPGTSITIGAHHSGVTNLSGTAYNITGYIYPADQGYLEATIDGQVIATLNLSDVWGDVIYTDSSQSKVNILPRTATEQTDYPVTVGPHGTIELTERMTYVPPQTSLPFPYYQTAQYRLIFNPYDWQNNNSVYGQEELGVIVITHYTNPTKTTIIGSASCPSVFNDVG